MAQLLELPGIKHRRTHGNLGKGFEDSLERTHEIYERQGRGKVIHLRNGFGYCAEAAYQRLSPYLKARLGTGQPMVREQTEWDFCGVVNGRPVAFDAKEFSGAALPLSELKLHQIENLCAFATAGGLAGFMIHAAASGHVFWLDAFRARELSDKATYAPKGRVAGVIKSLNMAWLSENALRVGQLQVGGCLDWAATLIIRSDS